MNNKRTNSVVITAHANADFDALASMVGASKLYDDAVLVFPGTQEKSIREFFIHSATYLFNFVSMKEIDPEYVTTLVVVDTRQRSRLNHVAALLKKKDMIIHTYDHHPDSEEDLQAQQEIVRPWGSTTAILVDIFREKNISLTPDEATILGLGLYEDTGSFSFNSTTEHDFQAGAWLKTQGMELNTISDLLSRDLTAEQISLLNELLESATTHDIKGVDVVIAEVTTKTYHGDFALLAHKLLDMENVRVLFALGRMDDRVHIVARSRTPEVDVGQICTSMGGGGHAYAASATVKDRTLAQVKDELFGLLYSHINPEILVRDLMSKPAITISKTEPITSAAETMTRFGLKAMPVIDPETNKCTGIIEHQLAEKAVGHRLGDVQTREYMKRDIETTAPGNDLYPVMEIILGQQQRLVPVVENEEVVGVITRTDLINFLVEEPARIPESLLPERKKERNINSLLREQLPSHTLDLLRTVGDLAEELNYDVYAVGGFVRDILLRQENLDIDLVVEGDGIVFARKMSTKLGGRIRAHDKFKTAVVILENKQHIDVATARLEYYEYPAALPTVELSSIKMDLYRRDFTINTLAVHLNTERFGRLVDFFGGQRDIKEGVIRVLHSLSFVEDPTRILRAVRFEKRFHFQIGPHTERLIKNALELNMFHKLSGSRIFQEFKLIMKEKNTLSCFKRLAKLHVLEAIHPLLTMDPSKETILEEVEEVLNWYRLLYIKPEPKRWLVFFMGITSGINEAQASILCRRMQFSKKQERYFLDQRRASHEALGNIFEWHKNQEKMSTLYFILSPLSLEAVLYLMSRSRNEEIRKAFSIYLTQLRPQNLDINGKDLKKMGLTSGPDYAEVLKKVMAAKLDDVACDRQSQLELARKLVSQYNNVPSES